MSYRLMAQMTAEQWAHLEIVGGVLIPIILFWIDTRRQTHKNHTENQVRLGNIETKIDPIWTWWNDKRDRRKGDSNE